MDKEKTQRIVKEAYGKTARKQKSCGCCWPDTTQYAKSIGYTDEELKSVPDESNLALGCGNPIALASLKEGEVVLDLGSGAGFDCFLAANRVGSTGKVIGVDMTPEMIEKARDNAKRNGIENVEFRPGEIESLPVEDDSVDVVISNCVLNLVPDKERAFSEIKRVLKPGGHFCVSDIVLKGELPDDMREAAALYAGCVSGALQKEDYLQIVKDAGYSEVEVKDERINDVPDEYLRESVSQETIDAYRDSGAGIFSITVVGTK